MDFHLKQWRNQHESEQQQSAKIPKLLLEPHQQSSGSALPLFVPELPNSKFSSLSAFPDSISPASRFPRMGSYFSLAQWQEFELQTLTFRYIMSGAAVPPELLQPIKKSLLHITTPHFLLQPCPHIYQPALLQSGYYWGRASMDPNPGQCCRTDGKKWRCSRDVVAGRKYCERHVHRGRNRSRKPVETPTLSTTTTYACGVGALKAATTAPPLATVAGGTHLFSLSGPSSSNIDLFHLNQSSSGSKTENKENEVSGDGKSDGNILRHFFDDWPRLLQESHDNAGSNASPTTSATCSLSIWMPENPSSDVSLKFSTGDGDEPDGRKESNAEQEQPQLNWASSWATNQVASVEGLLAEALRSSISNSSPNECSSSIAP